MRLREQLVLSFLMRTFGYYVERLEITVTCGVVVVDDQGKVVNDGGPCDPSPATLNFYLRPETVR